MHHFLAIDTLDPLLCLGTKFIKVIIEISKQSSGAQQLLLLVKKKKEIKYNFSEL